MKLLVLVGGLILGVALAVASDVKNIQTGENSCQCLEVPGSICAGHFNVDNWYAQFPNARGLDLTGSIGEFFHYYPLLELDNYCSHVLFNLLCFHYFPKCSLERPNLAATPCRETCTEVVGACLPHFQAGGYPYPQHLNCTNFHSGEIECGESSGEPDGEPACNSQCTACPKPRIHLEFALPPGKTAVEGRESDGAVPVCVKLANVGSYNTNDTLEEEVTVMLRPTADSAEAGSDFVQQNTTIVFPVGSPKGEIKCADIVIVNDGPNEEEEEIIVFADIIGPSTALFGGSLESSSGRITVKIDDDEEDPIVMGLTTAQAKVTEGDGFVQVGVRLADIGSLDTLSQEVTVTFCPISGSAEATSDYLDHCSSIVFRVGSRAGDTAHVNVTIVDDKLKEDEEIFVVLATITSSNAIFEGTLQGSANITVTICDDDDHVAPEDECSKKCNWRTRVNKKTFTNNPYTYVAHIRVIGCGDSVVDVVIDQCFNIECGVCPPDETKYSLPYCPSCSGTFDQCPIGKEYIVAGKHSSDSLYIGSTKPSGVLADFRLYHQFLNTVPECP